MELPSRVRFGVLTDRNGCNLYVHIEITETKFSFSDLH